MVEYSLYHMAVAVVRRNNRGRVVERALTRFKTEDHYEQFKKLVYKKFIGYEIYSVNIREAQPPSGKRESGTFWCPYCASWNKYFEEDGYTKCEICCVSTRDFHTMRYNRNYGAVSDTKPAKVEDSNKAEQRRLRREKRKKKAK